MALCWPKKAWNQRPTAIATTVGSHAAQYSGFHASSRYRRHSAAAIRASRRGWQKMWKAKEKSMWCADAAAHSHCSDGPPRPGATPCAAALWSISRTVVGGGCDAAALRFSSAVRSSRPVSFGVRSSNVSTSVSPLVSTSISSWDGSMARSSRRQEEAGDGQVDGEEE